jgi:glutathione synthase/RimK-type ligase-like ATP-grasp enzyme
VINNPFWWSADDKFFNNALADTLGVPLPNTVILPSAEHPTDTNAKSFRNLKFPMDWDSIFDYIGFPAYMKPYAGGGWKNVYRLENKEEFWQKHQETGQLVMMLQEEIVFQDYYRVYCLGCKDVLIMPYEPRNPHHLRYVVENPNRDKKLMAKIKECTLKLCKGLGYDFNTVEFAIRDGIPYAIDFGNPAPDAEYTSVGPENFEWVVESSAKMAIAAAKKQKEGQINLTWGNFIKDAAK